MALALLALRANFLCSRSKDFPFVFHMANLIICARTSSFKSIGRLLRATVKLLAGPVRYFCNKMETHNVISVAQTSSIHIRFRRSLYPRKWLKWFSLSYLFVLPSFEPNRKLPSMEIHFDCNWRKKSRRKFSTKAKGRNFKSGLEEKTSGSLNVEPGI